MPLSRLLKQDICIQMTSNLIIFYNLIIVFFILDTLSTTKCTCMAIFKSIEKHGPVLCRELSWLVFGRMNLAQATICCKQKTLFKRSIKPGDNRLPCSHMYLSTPTM